MEAYSSDAKTSCTRRFRALQHIHPILNSNQAVESGLIPHGQIIFAFHYLKLSETQGLTSAGSLGFTADGSSRITRTSRSSPEDSSFVPPSDSAHNYQGFEGQKSWQLPSPSPVAQTSSVSKQHISPEQRQTSIYANIIPPPRHRETRIYPEEVAESSRDTYNNTTGSRGNPPAGITRCAACKSVSSPEWRKGPSGKKDLCNACGLRYSRAKAKKEGITSRRRRDTRAIQEADMIAIKGHTSDEGLTNFSLHHPQQRLNTSASHSRDSTFETFHQHSNSISPPPTMYTYTMESRHNPMQFYSYPTTGGVTYAHTHYPTSYHHRHANTSSYHASPASGNSATGYMFHSVSSAAAPPSSYVRGLSSERRDGSHTESDHHYGLR